MRDDAAAPLLAVEGVGAAYVTKRDWLGRATAHFHALTEVSFSIRRGGSYGLVGESGSGKTTITRVVLGLQRPSAGRVLFDGRDVQSLVDGAADARRRLRRQMQIVFQDPQSSLNPRLRVERIVGEAMRVHWLVSSRADMRQKVAELLRLVGLRPDDMRRYPHQFSGGQRQRIGIARALALGPRLLICDEPTSALDVSVQAAVLNLLGELRQALGMTYLFVSHNLAVVRHMCDRIGVMQRGRLVEEGPAASILDRPQAEYTRHLLRAAAYKHSTD
jgi:ABC-type glutathione transport system ATPase component